MKKTSLVKAENKEASDFYTVMFDKYNMQAEDVDQAVDQTADFEPLASYQEMIRFLEGSGQSPFSRKSKGKVEPNKLEHIKDLLIHIITEDYEENKHNISLREKKRIDAKVSVKDRNLARMRYAHEKEKR